MMPASRPPPGPPYRGGIGGVGVEDGAGGGRGQFVQREDVKVGQALRLRLQHRRCHRRRGGLEADAQEDHRPVGMFAGNLQRIQRGVDDAHVGPGGPGRLQGSVAPRHPEHVAEGGQGHAGQPGQGDGAVQVGGGGDTDGAAGTGAQLDRGGEQVAQAVAEDGVGVAAAELHEAHGLFGARADARQ